MKIQKLFLNSSLLLFALAMCLGLAQITLAAGAREYENPPCYDITGASTPLNVGGVPNGGTMDFDDAGVDPSYQACVRMSSFLPTATPTHLEGWVWDSNLGWVSLYCPGGAGAKNLDIPCGSVAYSVTFTTTGTGPDFTSVKLSGNAWGDNTGYISFNSAFHQTSPIPSGVNKGLINTSVGASAYHAWSDSVGWLDLRGVHLYWYDTDPPVTDPNVIKYISVCSSKDPIPPLSSPPDSGTSYSSGGNGPFYNAMAINSAATNLWVVNVTGKNLVRLNISSGAAVVAATYTSAVPDQDNPANVAYDDTNNRLYMTSYSFATDYGIVSLNPTTLAVNWAKPISHFQVFDQLIADPANDAAWVLADNGSGTQGILYKYRGSDGTLLATLTLPAGDGVRSIVKSPSGNFIWMQQTDGKLVKVNSAGAYFGGTYAASLYDPGYSPSLLSFQMAADTVDNAIWVGSFANNKLYKLKAADGSPFNGTVAASTYSSPVSNPQYINFDATKKALWVIGSSSTATGKVDSQTGANLGMYPDVTPTNPVGVVHDDVHNVIWTAEGAVAGKVWKTPRDPILNAPGASTCTCDLDGTCPMPTDPTKIPDANGTDDYDIKIPFVDGGATVPSSDIDECPAAGTIDMYTMAPGSKEYCAKIALQWEDDVDYDQTVKASQKQATPQFNATNNGAVRKPLTSALFGASDFTYDGANQLWGAKVTSYAPTSDRNTMEGMSNEKFYYSDIAPSTYDGTKTDQNLLKLKGINLMFYKYSTAAGVPGTCIYGSISGSTCSMNNYMSGAGSTFSFNPLASIPTLSFKDLSGKLLNFISVSSPDSPLTFPFQSLAFGGPATAKSLTITSGMQDSSVYRLKMVTSFPQTPESPNPNVLQTLTVPGGAAIPLTNILGQLFSDTPGATVSADAGPFIYTKLGYTVTGSPSPTLYYGPKLPRIKAGLLLNPVAKVEGNVYVTDFGQKAADVSLHSLGNISSNLRREAVVRNVAKYLNGFTGTLVAGNKTVSTGTTASINNLNTLISDANRKVFYLKGANLTIDCGATCAFDSDVTFIVENGNIFVNSNIVPTGSNQVGLIALRDLSSGAQNQGMLYIDKNVTWLSGVQVYLDRVVQSYDKSVAVVADANGFAKYAGDDDYGRQSRFQNQLVLEGTISSMNGIGNASRSPATDENGTPLAVGTYCANYGGAGPVSNICRARVVDLNYLRYYGPGLEICDGTGPGTPVAGAPRDQALKGNDALSDGCDPAAAGYDINANDLYDATNNPTGDLIAGAAGGTPSTYFTSKSLPNTIANQFPVNFFYKPIDKNLGGFEVEQNVNQVTQ